MTYPFDKIIDSHENWRKTQTLNLIPSENWLSPRARKALSSDWVNRYTNTDAFYGGTKYSDELEVYCETLAKEVYNSKYANIRSLSGHLSVLGALLSLTKQGDSFFITGDENGGYPLVAEPYNRKPIFIPYKDLTSIDVEKTIEMIKQEKPPLVFLGCSFLPFPHPVKEIAEAVHEYEGYLVFDASHPLGLIAGGEFQNPLKEGADVMIGSTHKTFPGPQGGLCVGNNEEAMKKIDTYLGFPCILVDNIHLHRIGALTVTLEELKKFGKQYAKQVISNAKTLGKSLFESGLALFGEEKGFTESHIIWWVHTPAEIGWGDNFVNQGMKIKKQLEMNNIISDIGVRFGSQELTRRGAKEKDMEEISLFVLDAIKKEKRDEDFIRRIKDFMGKFQEAHYC
ncbi:MAG: aminotransferase class I/II-fold pyridoxal phosphate-dependent enzyme [Candidatus Ranarchaeia archaeon]